MADIKDLDMDACYTVSGWDGIAFYIRAIETLPDEDTEWTGIENETGNLLMVMVGDDKEYIIRPDMISVIDDEDYCNGCGQIGCGW